MLTFYKTKSRLIIQTVKTLLILLIIFLLFSKSSSVLAQTQENFYTTLTSTYTVDTTGNTQVEHHFRIRNLTPEFFISRYGMKLNTDSITNIQVKNENKSFNPEIIQSSGSTEINLEFEDKLVGKDKVRDFTISYQNQVLSEVSGQVLETFIPGLESTELYNERQIILKTPIIFGHPSRINPSNNEIKQEDQHFVLTYTDLGEKGISAIFGSEQIFELQIRYHLNNPGSQPAITQVSLPPDTPYQKIFYQELEPKPQTIEADVDGNWIATYFLPANDVVEVNILASVLVSLEQIQPWLNIKPLSAHLNRQLFWETDDLEIQKLAQQYPQPENIYDFVINKLSYTQEDLNQKFERLGAIKALENPTLATCQEFSDLFIAIARAGNIPAKRATGYAHSNDPILQPLSLQKDILHAWPEYYDQEKQIWIPIDPTWGDTMKNVDYFHQLDLKRVVFAYNGKSSRYPLAAGDYKLPNQDTKDIKVSFNTEFPDIKPEFDFKIQPKKIFGFINLPSQYELSIINKTGQAWYNNQLTLSVNNLSDQELNLIYPNEVITILPFQTRTLDIQVFNHNHLFPKANQLQLKLTNQEYEQQQTFEIKTVKQYTLGLTKFNQLSQSAINEKINTVKLNPKQFFIGLGIISGILAVSAGSILVFRRKK